MSCAALFYRRAGAARQLRGIVVLTTFAISLTSNGLLACRQPPEVSLSVSLPNEHAAEIAWLDIAAFPGVRCTTALRLSQSGFPEAGLSSRVSVPIDNLSPALGNIPKAFHSFVVLARTADCTTVARGCADGDTTDVRDFTIALDAIDPTIACDPGLACVEGRCTAVKTGAKCSMNLLGTSPFTPQVIVDNGSYVATSPAIAAVGNSFVASFSEFLTTRSPPEVLLTVQRITEAGGAGQARSLSLSKRCLNYPQDDGTSIIPFGTGVVVGVSLTSCATSPATSGGIDLLTFSVAQNESETDFSALPIYGQHNSEAGVVRGYGAHFLATNAFLPTRPWVAEIRNDANRLIRTDSNQYLTSPGEFGGGGKKTLAALAATKEILAFASIGIGTSADAGAGTGSTLRVGLSKSDPLDITAFTSTRVNTPATWASIVGINARAFVVHDTVDPGVLTVRGFDLGAAGEAFPAVTITLRPKATGGAQLVEYADIATAGNRLFIASGMNGDIAITIFELAAGVPVAKTSRTVYLSDIRPQLVQSVRDGRVAIAANPQRVALAWLTASELERQEPLGGYAVFACEP